MSKEAIQRWKDHQERDRVRSLAYRRNALQIGRPLPAAVDRAIAEAVAKVWGDRIATIAGNDRSEGVRRKASMEPISAHKIAEAAVEILAEKQRRKLGSVVDLTVIGRAVMARLRPPLPRAPRVV
ncbi:hypothetical protein HNR47_003357 [Methylopila jiangsuensis]|nr:hypothetical protein [Methylopila jiangsuensis]MDR6287327.1 hypothetical protein [Methylopila jiangsuensis]